MALSVKIFSDYVCPYCYIGQGLIDKLLEEPDLPLDIRWLPFELHPGTGPHGVPLTQKFGVPEQAVQEILAGLRQRAAEVGLPMDPPATLYNTRRAHRLAEYAADQGDDVAGGVRRLLFKANFVEGRNLAETQVLQEIAGAAGLDGDAALAALDDPQYDQRIASSMEQAQQFGVTGVPAFIVEDRYRIVGALPYDHLVAAFRQIQAESR